MTKVTLMRWHSPAYTNVRWPTDGIFVTCSSELTGISSLFLQAYFRQGVALQYLGRHADALAAFASGLAQDPKSLQLLVGMVEAAMKSPMRGKCWCRSVQISTEMCAAVALALFSLETVSHDALMLGHWAQSLKC